jgi:ribulose-5-phosphate 4-epimerase/fuculose-1-phosphate aldolase
MSESDESVLKRRVALANRIAYLEGLHEQLGNEFSGHISARFGENKIIMPGHLHDQGRGLRDIMLQDMITIDLHGNIIEGKHKTVDEVIIHAAIYRERAEINSVVHLHPPTILALASTDTPLLPLTMRSSYFAQGVPVLEKRPGIIDDEETAKEMLKVLGHSFAMIHKGHGIVTIGRSLEEACTLAMYLESAARTQLVATQFGGRLKPFEHEAVVQYANSHSLKDRPFVWNNFEKKWENIQI